MREWSGACGKEDELSNTASNSTLTCQLNITMDQTSVNAALAAGEYVTLAQQSLNEEEETVAWISLRRRVSSFHGPMTKSSS